MTIRQLLDEQIKEMFFIIPDFLLEKVNAFLMVSGEKIRLTKRDIVEYLNSHPDFFQDGDMYRRFICE